MLDILDMTEVTFKIEFRFKGHDTWRALAGHSYTVEQEALDEMAKVERASDFEGEFRVAAYVAA